MESVTTQAIRLVFVDTLMQTGLEILLIANRLRATRTCYLVRP